MEITKRSYSSSANLGPGYDILSLSHSAFYDSVRIEANNKNGNIKIISANTPEDPNMNTAGLSVKKIMQDRGINDGLNIYIDKGIPIGLGLGSSGASSSAAVKAFDELFDLKLSKDEMVYYSMQGEIAACGSAHPDNVSSGIYGGMTLISSNNPVKVKKIKVNYNLKLLLVIPELDLKNKTEYARSLVPKNIDMASHVKHMSYISTMIYGIMSGDRESIRLGMNDDIVETSRSPLFPYYKHVKDKAIENNAISACVSGAGPTMLILIDEYTKKNDLLAGVKNIMNSFGMVFRIIETDIMEEYND
ncbi:MAG: homoserine kinase [Ferroplasma sp.]